MNTWALIENSFQFAVQFGWASVGCDFHRKVVKSYSIHLSWCKFILSQLITYFWGCHIWRSVCCCVESLSQNIRQDKATEKTRRCCVSQVVLMLAGLQLHGDGTDNWFVLVAPQRLRRLSIWSESDLERVRLHVRSLMADAKKNSSDLFAMCLETCWVVFILVLPFCWGIEFQGRNSQKLLNAS